MLSISDDEQRSLRPQDPCALRVPAAWGHLLRCRSLTILRHRLRRGALQLAPRRSERGGRHYSDGLLGSRCLGKSHRPAHSQREESL